MSIKLTVFVTVWTLLGAFGGLNAQSFEKHPVDIVAAFEPISGPRVGFPLFGQETETGVPTLPQPLTSESIDLLLEAGIESIAFTGTPRQVFSLFSDPAQAMRVTWVPVFPELFLTRSRIGLPELSPDSEHTDLSDNEQAEPEDSAERPGLEVLIAEFVDLWVASGLPIQDWVLYPFPDRSNDQVTSWMQLTTNTLKTYGWVTPDQTVFILNLGESTAMGKSLGTDAAVEEYQGEAAAKQSGSHPTIDVLRKALSPSALVYNNQSFKWVPQYPDTRAQMGQLTELFNRLSETSGSTVFINGDQLLSELASNPDLLEAYKSFTGMGITLFPLPGAEFGRESRADIWNVVKLLVLVGFFWFLRAETYFGQRFYRYFANYTFLNFEVLDKRIRSNLTAWISSVLVGILCGLLGSQWSLATFGELGLKALATAIPSIFTGIPPRIDTFLIWFSIGFSTQLLFAVWVWASALRQITFQQAMVLVQWPSPLLSFWLIVSILFSGSESSSQTTSIFLMGMGLLIHISFIASLLNVAKLRGRGTVLTFILSVSAYAAILITGFALLGSTTLINEWIPYALSLR